MRIRTHFDLFSGIGGFALGFRRAGIQTVGFCEIDPYCQKILNNNFPGVSVLTNITGIKQEHIDAIGKIDIITGGFPCQDISLSGPGGGIYGERSKLFFELMRVVRMARPKIVIMENSPALLTNDGGNSMRAVLREIAVSGYDALWRIVSARDFGAPHLRRRIWIVCYPSCFRLQRSGWGQSKQIYETGYKAAPHFDGIGCARGGGFLRVRPTKVARGIEKCTHIMCQRLAIRIQGAAAWKIEENSTIERCARAWWSSEPSLVRMVYGVPNRVDRIKGLGNSIVPWIAEKFAKSLLDCWESESE